MSKPFQQADDNSKKSDRPTKSLRDQTNYHRLDAMKGADIDYSDIQATDEDFWADAEIRDPGPKVAISIRVDGDVLRWYKHQKGRYQRLMNDVLREYMNAHRR